MKVKLELNTNELVIKTIGVLTKRKMDTQELDNSKLLRTTCVWSDICIEYFGFNSYKNCLLIRQRWLRNTNNYRTLVKNQYLFISKPLESNEQMEIDADEAESKLSYKIDERDWFKIQKYISGFYYKIMEKNSP